MFLRRNRKRSSGELYEYWTLCETVRTAKGPRQRLVATLGKLTEEDLATGWEDSEELAAGCCTEFGEGRGCAMETALILHPHSSRPSEKQGPQPHDSLTLWVVTMRS